MVVACGKSRTITIFSAIFRKLMEKCADYGPTNY